MYARLSFAQGQPFGLVSSPQVLSRALFSSHVLPLIGHCRLPVTGLNADTQATGDDDGGQ